MKKSLGILWMFCVLASGAQERSKENVNSVYLSYNKHAYAVYEAWRGSGTLSFLFVSNKSEAFVAYQDDGAYKNFDLFLVKGNLRLRVTLNDCVQEQLTIGGNFSDSQWHRVHLTRMQTNVTLTVDRCLSKNLHCKWSFSANRWRALYVGSIPLNVQLNSLASPSIYYETLQSGFQGCIGQLTRSTHGKGPRALLLRETSGTGSQCRMPCSSNHKRCTVSIDDVIHECECPGYWGEECWEDMKQTSGVVSDSSQVSLSLLVSNSLDSIPKFSSKPRPFSTFLRHDSIQPFSVTKIHAQSTPVHSMFKKNARVTEAANGAKHARSKTPNIPEGNPIRLTEQVETAPTCSNWLSSSPWQLGQSSLPKSTYLYSVPGHFSESTVTSWDRCSQVNVTAQAKKNVAFLSKNSYFILLCLLCHAGL